MDNQRKKVKLDSKTLSSISNLIAQKSKKINNTKKKKSNKKNQLQDNPQNNIISHSNVSKVKKRPKKNKLKHISSQNSEVFSVTSSADKIKKSKKKKQKHSQNLNNTRDVVNTITNATDIQNTSVKIKKKKNKLKPLLNDTKLELINSNNDSQNTSMKRKKKSKGTQNEVSGENKSVAKNEQNSENLQQTKSKQKRNKNKLKRLQNKPAFKLDQQDTNSNLTAVTNNPKLEKQVKKDLLNKFNKTLSNIDSKPDKSSSLREKMLNQLKSSRFRYLNEQLYTREGKDAREFFQSDTDSFKAYHEGFRQQVAKWPMNPLDKIIAAVKKMPTDYIIADFGCGEAKLARSVPHKVYSFDLVETVPGVIACDMAHCKLPADTVDVAVYCLSLMGTNLREYLAEANRVLKIGGILKIAEVESRFEKIENFIQGLQSFGFKLTWKDLSHNLFYFLNFKKEKNIKNKNKLPTLSLNPCLYKKR